MVEKEDGYFLVGLRPNIDSPVDPRGRLVPIDLPRCNREPLLLTSIQVVQGQGIAAQYNCNPVERIAVPGHGIAW